MKKVFYVLAASLLVSCSGSKSNESAATQDNAETVAVETTDENNYELEAIEANDEEFAEAEEFISYVVNDMEWNDTEWIEAHCSASVIERLKEDNPYEGEGLAIWELKGELFESEEMNAAAEVTGFGYGMLHGIPVYYLEKMYRNGEERVFSTTYYGLERNNDDFRIIFFDYNVPQPTE